MKKYLLAAALAVAVVPAHAEYGQRAVMYDVTPVVPPDVAQICGTPQQVIIPDASGTLLTKFDKVPFADRMERLRIKLRAEYDAQCQVKMQQFAQRQYAERASQAIQAEADRRNQAEIARLQLEQEKQRTADNEARREQEEADRPLIEKRQRLARENEAAESKRYEEQKARDEEAARIRAAQAAREADENRRKAIAARQEAEAEARKPSSRLAHAYQAYSYVRFCHEVREGYLIGYVNDVELERATTAIKAYAKQMQGEDASINLDSIWQNASAANRGRYANEYECKAEYAALLKLSPVPTFDNSRPQ